MVYGDASQPAGKAPPLKVKEVATVELELVPEKFTTLLSQPPLGGVNVKFATCAFPKKKNSGNKKLNIKRILKFISLDV